MNPIQSILVHLDAGLHGSARLQVARTWGGRLGASVAALYAVTPASLGVSMVFTAGVPSQELLAYDEARLAAAHRSVREACIEPGVQIEWREATDTPERAFVQQALYADLLVLGQHDGTRHDSGVSASFVHAAIIESGKPALVIPSGVDRPGSTFDSVLLAWKESREAARALTGALPLLQKADTVCVALDADAGHAHRPLLQRFLQRHGVDDVQFRSVAGAAPQAGDTLLSMAADVGASLLVMGCYGHSRGREWILGGATRSVLLSMNLPVLMAH
jgi:nucleotide-binding universal stress UspA family protein